jgi:hypothetical protein
MLGACSARCARSELAISAESNLVIVGLCTRPRRSKRPPSVVAYSGPRPSAVATQVFAVVMREFAASTAPNVQHVVKVQHVSVTSLNRIACGQVSCGEQHADVITRDTTMLTSHGKLSANTTKHRPATRVAALWIASVTFAGAAVTSAQSTSAASTPASSALEVQVQILRDCRDADSGRVDGFEGMLSDFVCGS